MSTRTFRVTVRGVFDGLSAQQRAELLADAAEHDVLHAAFTASGHLTYDIAARPAFTFRFQDSGESAEDLAAATARAQAAAEAWLTGRGYGHKNLRAQGEDLSEAPLGKRQRRELRKDS
jgi:3,4-dihydroxy-2-butanone 4-phosphate synthase